MAVNFKDLTDEELKAWDPTYKGKGKGKRRTGKGGPGPIDKAIKGAWDATLEGFAQQHATEQLIRKGVKTDIGKGVKRLFRGTDRPLTTQQKQRQSLKKSMLQLKEGRLARGAEIARRSKLTPKEQQSEKKQRFLNQHPQITETKKEVGIIPESAPVQKTDPMSLSSWENALKGRFPELEGATQRWNSLPKDQQQQALAEDKPSVIEELTKRERFALGQVRGSVAQNKARAKEIKIEQQRELLGKNISVGTDVGGASAAANLKTPKINIDRTERIGNMQDFMKNSSPKMKEFMKNNPAAAEDLLRDAGKGNMKSIKKQPDANLATKAKDFAKSFVPNPWVLLAKAVAFAANPSHDDKALPFNNRSPNIAQDFQIDEENLKYMA